jgi:murein DD-endopeptidase MepM/ murein hydrolase activator NlpD
MAENVPDRIARAVKITPDTAAGNFVILDIGGGHFVMYAHLRPGTLRVKTGDTVKRGDVIGLLGNSGNSTGPHLHFQVSNTDSPLATEGLPFVFDSYEVQSRAGAAGDSRAMSIPLNGERIKFP